MAEWKMSTPPPNPLTFKNTLPPLIAIKNRVHKPVLIEKMFMQSFPLVAYEPSRISGRVNRLNTTHNLVIVSNVTFIKVCFQQQRFSFFSF